MEPLAPAGGVTPLTRAGADAGCYPWRVPLLQRAEQWITPTSLSGDWRLPFFVRTWAYGMGFGLLFGLLAAVQGLWWVCGAQLYLVGCGALSLGLMRVTARLRLVCNLSLALVTPFLALVGLMQNPPNPIAPVFLVLVPLLASFMLSRPEMTGWLLASIVVGGLSEWLMANGIHLPGPLRPHQGVVTALNLGALMLLLVSFVRWFDSVRRDALSQLEAASQARTIFLANVSHEIRTPMNGVLGMTELLLAGSLDAAQREKVELVQRSGQSMVTLIDDLLLVTRAESGRLVLLPGPTAVHKVVADVVELFAPQARDKGIALRSVVDAAVPPWVELDGVRWRQVLSNVVSNAVKFTERGEVEVHLGAEARRLVLRVQDQGMGIEPSVLARLFRPFEQADTSTTRRFGGSGLGLALSKQLAELMGGTLAVESQPGRGSVFVFDVPLLEAKVEAPTGVEVGPGAPTSRKTVLVVDDNPINLLVARGLVERAGYEVQLARNGREAVEAVAGGDFGMVLMDCQMPVMDGLEATRLIRASAAHGALPIVAVTASGLPEELAACRAAGMNDCLVKPISLEMVQRVLRLALP